MAFSQERNALSYGASLDGSACDARSSQTRIPAQGCGDDIMIRMERICCHFVEAKSGAIYWIDLPFPVAGSLRISATGNRQTPRSTPTRNSRPALLRYPSRPAQGPWNSGALERAAAARIGRMDPLYAGCQLARFPMPCHTDCQALRFDNANDDARSVIALFYVTSTASADTGCAGCSRDRWIIPLRGGHPHPRSAHFAAAATK